MVRVHRIDSKREQRRLRVAAYARVSTGKNDQLESYETQVAFYTEFIGENPDWIYAGIYTDPGKSAIDAEHRPGFQRMITDAFAGKIDVIYCKEISRFARNILDAQRYTHELKERDVEVRFQTENISTFDPSTELMFSIKAMFAQEESHNISEKVRWGYEQRAKQGIRHIGNNRVLGYDEEDGALIPNEDAWIVKLIFDSFAEGQSPSQIVSALTKAGAKTLRSCKLYEISSIMYILKNEVYTGDRLLQKAAPKNYLTKRPDPTMAFNSYFLPDDHPAIIDRMTWERVQARLRQQKEQREEGIHVRGNTHFLFGKVFCAECGAPYKRRTVTSKGRKVKLWNCAQRQAGKAGNGCKNANIPEEGLLRSIARELGIEGIDSMVILHRVERVVISGASVKVKAVGTV